MLVNQTNFLVIEIRHFNDEKTEIWRLYLNIYSENKAELYFSKLFNFRIFSHEGHIFGQDLACIT